MPEVRECKDVFVINKVFHFWGHCFLYDQETLHQALYSSGFREIKFYKPGDSENSNLRNLESTEGRSRTRILISLRQLWSKVVRSDRPTIDLERYSSTGFTGV